MAGQKEIRLRIASTVSTQQITKAMKLVSATKLRKAQDRITRMRPYALKLKGILQNLSDSVDDDRLQQFFKDREANKVLLVVITSDRGLCGPFNANVVKRTRQVIETRYAEAAAKGGVTLMFVGKKGMEAFKRSAYQLNTEHMGLLQDLTYETAFETAEDILSRFLSGEFDRVEVIYNRFKNAATQIVSDETLLPVTLEIEEKHAGAKNDYIFEPGKIEILQDLVPRSLKMQLFRALLDSSASEHGARMVAMDKATDNAGELLRQLKLQYNRARQASITSEISEIVGGVAALQG